MSGYSGKGFSLPGTSIRNGDAPHKHQLKVLCHPRERNEYSALRDLWVCAAASLRSEVSRRVRPHLQQPCPSRRPVKSGLLRNTAAIIVTVAFPKASANGAELTLPKFNCYGDSAEPVLSHLRHFVAAFIEVCHLDLIHIATQSLRHFALLTYHTCRIINPNTYCRPGCSHGIQYFR